MIALQAVARGRVVVVVSYVLLAAWVTYNIAIHSSAPTPVARQDLKADHKLEPGDLQTEQTAALIGRFLRRDVGLGNPITPDMISAQRLPPRIANTIAAIVTVPQETAQKRGIVEGAAVLVTQNGKPLTAAGKVVGLDCDEQACTITVALPKTPGQTIDPDAVLSADIELAPPPAPTVP
jgi:hypothetical protein